MPYSTSARKWTAGGLGVPDLNQFGSDLRADLGSPVALGAAMARTLAARFADTVNLRDYILAVDADATNGLRRALARAQALNGPVVIDVPPGLYVVSGAISVSLAGAQAIHLRGAGSAVTVLRQVADADGIAATVGNYGPNTFLGGCFNVSGIGFEMGAVPTAPRTALSISTTGVSGNTGWPLVLDDIAVLAHVGPQQWGTGVRIDGFANTAYLSRISCIFGNGAPSQVGVSINGNAQSYSTAIFLNDVMLTGMTTGLVLGNYLQGIHAANLFTLNTDTAVQCTPTAGDTIEITITGSYLMGRSVFRPLGTSALNTVRIVNSYFDWANTTPGATHVTFENCPALTLIGDTFNGSVSSVYAPGTVGLSIAGTTTPTLVQGCTFQNYGGLAGQTGTGVALAASTQMCNFLGNAFQNCATPVSDLGPTNTFAHTTVGFQYYAFSLPFGPGVSADTARFPNAGLSVAWNLSAGGGEVDLLLGRQAGIGGLNIYSVGLDGKVEAGGPIFSMDRFGKVAATDLSVAGTGTLATAWTVTNPAVISAGGSVTATGAVRAKKLGRIVAFTAEASITANNAGSGTVNISLPFAAAANEAFGGRDFSNGKGIVGVMTAGSTTLSYTLYDGSFPAVAGSRLVVSGTYEANA